MKYSVGDAEIKVNEETDPSSTYEHCKIRFFEGNFLLKLKFTGSLVSLCNWLNKNIGK